MSASIAEWELLVSQRDAAQERAAGWMRHAHAAEERADALRNVLEEIDECGASMRVIRRALAADDAKRGEA